MSAVVQTLPDAQPVPAFLRRMEPEAVYSYDSGGRLTIVKGDDAVCLSPDDLAALRRFVARVAGLDQ